MAFRSLVKDWLLRRGMVLSRPPGQFSAQQYKLAAAKARGFDVRSALDGGAAHGAWTRAIREVFPGAAVLAVEPRDEVLPELRRAAAELGRVEVAQTLLGSREGETTLYLDGEASSVNRDFAGGGTSVTMPVTTIDRLVERLNFPPVDLIKLDLQGAELAALDGATECLRRAKGVLLEVSFIDFEKGMPVIADVFGYMKARGYAAYDVLGLWHRPLDGAMAQGDVLFVPEASPLRADRRYWSADPTSTFPGAR
jgi:FkbM family methyltransferase